MKKSHYLPGQFCWVELQTSDVSGAREFYSQLLGWDFGDQAVTESDYSFSLYKGLPTAGIRPLSPERKAAAALPFWSSYICVEDVESTLAKAQSLGAITRIKTTKVGDHGHMAYLADPTGAEFALWQPRKHIGAGWVNDEGGLCWNELYTRDVERAKDFYEVLFAWEFQRADANGRDYWTIKNAGLAIAGMMEIRPDWGEVPASWSVYFAVASCSDELAKAKSLGAQIFLPPMEVPGVGKFAGLQDPQGAHFLIFEMQPKSE